MPPKSSESDHVKETIQFFRILRKHHVYELSDDPFNIRASVFLVLNQALQNKPSNPTMYREAINELREKIGMETLEVLRTSILQIGKSS